MQLNVTTDYALRVLLALHQNDGEATAEQISETMGISYRYLIKVLAKLKKAGLIKSETGPSGGYCLEVPLSQITVGDILLLMEKTTKINRCMEADSFCSRNAQNDCPVRRYYQALQAHLEKEWFSVTLEQVLNKF